MKPTKTSKLVESTLPAKKKNKRRFWRAQKRVLDEWNRAIGNGKKPSTERLHKASQEMYEYEFPPANRNGKATKVAILGKGWAGDLAPFGKPGWEIWGLNDPDSYPPLRCADRWFQLHSLAYMEKHYSKGWRKSKPVWKEKNGLPVYMQRRYKELPDSRAFPRKAIERKFPRGDYHASTFDWLVAYALLEGFEYIGLYGVGFGGVRLFNGEPLSGRACLEYWLGLAEGMGVTTEVVGVSDVFKIIHLAGRMSDLQYAYEEEPALELGGPWVDIR